LTRAASLPKKSLILASQICAHGQRQVSLQALTVDSRVSETVVTVIAGDTSADWSCIRRSMSSLVGSGDGVDDAFACRHRHRDSDHCDWLRPPASIACHPGSILRRRMTHRGWRFPAAAKPLAP